MATAIADVTLIAATVGNGLLAGLFFAFARAVTPALRTVDDRNYVTTFRAINSAILNPTFLFVFLATPLVTVVAAVLHLDPVHRAGLPWLLAGLACSVATFGITVSANVPLNRRLDEAPVDTDAHRTTARGSFERRWNQWNVARTLTGITALTLLAIAVAS